MILPLGLILLSLCACGFLPRLNPGAASSPSDVAGKELARGVWNDDVYTNEFAELQFTMPGGWLAATDEEIAALTGVGADKLTDAQKWAAEAAKLTTIYDMMAQDTVVGNSVIVIFENLSLTIGGMRMDEAGYFEVVKKQLENMENVEYTFDEPYDAKAGDVAFYTVRATETTSGVDQYYMMHKQDKYMVVVIVTIIDDTKLDDILAQFK